LQGRQAAWTSRFASLIGFVLSEERLPKTAEAVVGGSNRVPVRVGSWLAVQRTLARKGKLLPEREQWLTEWLPGWCDHKARVVHMNSANIRWARLLRCTMVFYDLHDHLPKRHPGGICNESICSESIRYMSVYNMSLYNEDMEHFLADWFHTQRELGDLSPEREVLMSKWLPGWRRMVFC
jgi:hypothetical protein